MCFSALTKRVCENGSEQAERSGAREATQHRGAASSHHRHAEARDRPTPTAARRHQEGSQHRCQQHKRTPAASYDHCLSCWAGLGWPWTRRLILKAFRGSLISDFQTSIYSRQPEPFYASLVYVFRAFSPPPSADDLAVDRSVLSKFTEVKKKVSVRPLCVFLQSSIKTFLA